MVAPLARCHPEGTPCAPDGHRKPGSGPGGTAGIRRALLRGVACRSGAPPGPAGRGFGRVEPARRVAAHSAPVCEPSRGAELRHGAVQVCASGWWPLIGNNRLGFALPHHSAASPRRPPLNQPLSTRPIQSISLGEPGPDRAHTDRDGGAEQPGRHGDAGFEDEAADHCFARQ